MSRSKPSIVVFGCYQDTDLYQRNRVLVRAILELGQGTSPVRPDSSIMDKANYAKLKSIKSVTTAFFTQLRQFVSLYRQRGDLRQADLFFVPYPAYLDRAFLSLLTFRQLRRPVIVDAFLCLHDTLVCDRGVLIKGSWFAKLAAWVERKTLCSADRVLIDTEQQKWQLCNAYGLEPAKVQVVPVGLDEELWQPLAMPPIEKSCRFLFWGTFIPLHGVETLHAAAKILASKGSDIEVEVIGEGQRAPQFAALLEAQPLARLHWQRGLVDTNALRAAISRSHGVLGIFGDSAKADSVIPYKVHQAMASNRLVITRHSNATQTLGAARPDLLLIPPANPKTLANAMEHACDYIRSGAAVTTREVYDVHLSSTVVKRSLETAMEGLFG